MPIRKASSKKIEIRQIVLLKQLMKRWRRSLSLRRSLSRSDSGSVRAGFLAVYVGPERRRFVIPTRFMNLPVFASLLEKAEEEFGFQPVGGLSLPCDAAFFTWVIDALERDEERFKGVGLDGFSKIFSDLEIEDSISVESSVPPHDSFSPLLQNTRA